MATEPDDGNDHGTDTEEVSVTFPKRFLDNELLPEYPAAANRSQAIRMAVQEAVNHKQQKITPATVRDTVVEALEEQGGHFENIQRVSIGEADCVEIEETNSVEIEGNKQ